MELNIYAAFNLFSIIQGIILVLILTFNKRYSRSSTIYLVQLLLICVSLNVIGIITELVSVEENPILYFIPMRFYALIPAVVYFFVHFILNPNYKIKKREYALYLPFIFDFTHQCYSTFCYMNGGFEGYKMGYWGPHFIIILLFEIGTGIIFLLVVYRVIIKLKAYEKSLFDQYSELSGNSINWIINTIIAGSLLVILWIITALLDFNPISGGHHYDRILWIGVTILIYWIGYALIIRPELFSMTHRMVLIGDQPTISPSEDKIKMISKLSEKTDEYHQQLIYLMEEKALYRDPEFNMDQLAEELKLSKGYLSQIINQKEGKNFFEFVNQYRVEDVKQKLSDVSYRHFSIIAIGREAGFKSKSSFYSVFKKQTGKSPSKFREKV